jgi:hypothetical protein
MGKLWNTYGNKLYRHYPVFLLFEGLFYTIITILMLTGIMSQKIYYIADTLIFAFITKNIVFGDNKLKVLRYEGELRNKFDNNSTIVINGACLIGFAISFVAGIPEIIAFIFLVIGMSVDNIFYYKAYRESKNKINV